jgi:hypothetical protein
MRRASVFETPVIGRNDATLMKKLEPGWTGGLL